MAEPPSPSRAEVEALVGGPVDDDDEWAGCRSIIDREAAHGVEVTARYLAWVVEQARAPD